MKDWDLTPEGNLKIGPVIGWETAIAPMIGLLRLRYAHSEEEFEAGGTGLQVQMTPVQLRNLSESLRQMADRIDAQNLGTAQ
ncbi:MAG: hypothetical protein J7530_08175 [Novosphingobium sp.]|nr:hypothetical protein [Novosphingobium sp.]